VQDLALGLVEPHTVGLCPLIQSGSISPTLPQCHTSKTGTVLLLLTLHLVSELSQRVQQWCLLISDLLGAKGMKNALKHLMTKLDLFSGDSSTSSWDSCGRINLSVN